MGCGATTSSTAVNNIDIIEEGDLPSNRKLDGNPENDKEVDEKMKDL